MARIEIRLEDPGSADEIEVIALFVRPGDSVTEGQPLIEVATDKANVELTAPQAGVVAEVLVAEGDIVAPPTEMLLVLT